MLSYLIVHKVDSKVNGGGFMQITEFFTSGLERALQEYSRGELSDFLPDSHTSLPDLQEHLLYLCAGGQRTLKQPDSFSFQDVNGFLLLYTESGRGEAETEGETSTLSPGTLLFWDCRDRITLKAIRSPWNVELFFFDGNAAAAYYEEICKLSFPVVKLPSDSPVLSCLKRLLTMGTETSPHHAILQNRLLTDILTDILLGMHIGELDEKPLPVYLKEIKHDFDNFYQRDYSVEILAEKYHISRYRLCREFSKYFGKPPVRYLNEVRLSHAKSLLESTNLRVHEVGSAVGIDNTTHFINLFKSLTGLTPQAYRDGYLSFRQIDI